MTTAAPLESLADFPDRLSPMVVKELRQGLRTRMFGSVLLVLHVLLVLSTLVSSVARNVDETRWLIDGLSVLVLCMVMPLRGFSALAEEIRANTLETLVLTRLSSARIVFGKWASLALQSLLVALSMMPYVVARYVYGGADLPGELTTLGMKWLIGIVVAAGVVCLSTQKQFWLRAVVVAMVSFAPLMASISITIMGRSSGGGAGSYYYLFSTPLTKALAGGWLALAVIAASAWLIFFFLSLAATRIAPAASHLAVVKRLVHALALLLFVLAAWVVNDPTGGLLIAAGVVASLATMDALIETRNEVPSLLIPFYRRGSAGRVLAWFLTPGWPNGMVYSVAITGGLMLAAVGTGHTDMARAIWLMVAGTWMCATLVHLVCASRWRDLLAPYIGMNIFLSVVQSFFLVISMTLISTSGVGWIGVLMPDTVEPTLTFARTNSKVSPGELKFLLWLGLGLSCLWPLTLSLMAALALRKTRSVRTEARLLAAESSS